MSFLTTIISFIVMFAIIVGVYVLCKKFVFGKVRINKWIPLSIAIILFIIQIFLGQINKYISYCNINICSIVFLMVYGYYTNRWT